MKKGIRKRQKFYSIITLFFVLLIFVQCKKENIVPEEETPSTVLELGASDFKQFQIVVFEKTGINAQNTQYQGNIGAVSVSVFIEDNFISFIIPDTLGSGLNLEVNIDGASYKSTDFSISSVGLISNPDLIFNNYVSDVNQFNSSSNLIDSIDIHTELANPSFHSDQLLFENYMSDLVNNFNSLDNSNKTKIAGFILANNNLFSELRQSIQDIPNTIPSYIVKSGNSDWEANIDNSMVKFKNAVIKAVVASYNVSVLGLSAVALLPPPLSAVALGLVVGNFAACMWELMKHETILINSVFSAVKSSLIISKSTINFPVNELCETNTTMNYTSLHAAIDFSNGASNQFKNSVNSFVKKWNEIISYIPFTTEAKFVEEITSFKTKSLDVHGNYLSVGNISNSNVSLISQSIVGGKLCLTFNSSTPEIVQEFTYELTYNSPFKSFSLVQNATIGGAQPLQWVEQPIGYPDTDGGCNDAKLWWSYSGGVGLKTIHLSGYGVIADGMQPATGITMSGIDNLCPGNYTVTVSDSDSPPNVITAPVTF